MYDVIIIGGGPAGISASLYTKRGNLKTLVLYETKSNLEKANENDYKYIKENINKLIRLVENKEKLIEKYFDI